MQGREMRSYWFLKSEEWRRDAAMTACGGTPQPQRSLPFQLVEDLVAEGLPSVVGVAVVEDAGLEDAGGALVAEEGVLQPLGAFRSFPQLA